MGDREAQPAYRVARRLPQRVVENDAHPLAALRIPDRAFLHAVAVLLQQQRLEADLDALRLVDAARDVGALATLVVDRRHHAVLGLRNVDLRDHAEPLRGESERAAGDLLRLVLQRLGRRQGRTGAVDPGVDAAAFYRVTGLRPLGLRPHEVGEARAVNKLVHHPRRHQRHRTRGRRRGQ